MATRAPIQIVQIDQDFCLESYGVSPCTASGAAGEECYNTLNTCQDTENFNKGTLTLSFGKQTDALPKDEYIIPSLVSVSASPTIINAGGGSSTSSPLGVRSTVSVTFLDHPHTDRLVDPYRTTRDYIATDRGTFWSKWIARNKYFTNRIMRVLDGYEGQALSEMQSRTYIIDSISGPNSNGSVTVKGKDILRLADDDKAVAPAASTGELIVDIDETQTTIRVTGALASAYPAPGYVRIGDEIISYSGVSTISDTEINLTGCARAVRGSEGSTAEAEDRVQWCLEYDDEKVADIAYDLLTTYGNVPTAYIDKTAWDDEGDIWLAQFNLSTLITEPTGVTTLLAEISEQTLFYIWWDERAQLINFKAIRPADDDEATKVNDRNNVIAGTTAMTIKSDERISQVWLYWGVIDYSQDTEEEKNYRYIKVTANLEEESADRRGEQVIKKIYSRWLQSNAQTINVAARLLDQFIDDQEYMTVSLDAKDRALWTGDIVDLTHYNIVDFSGAPEERRWQVISADEIESGHIMQYKLQRYAYIIGTVYGRWMADDAPDYVDADDDEKKVGAWWSDEDGLIDGETGYNWL